MIKIYIKDNTLQDENGNKLKIHAETVRVAQTGRATKNLKRVVKAHFGEKVIIFDANNEVLREARKIRC
jgi:hypothetical protein